MEASVNYGIAQADMYQMYAYQKKYDAVNVALLYPQTDQITSGEKIEYQSADGVVVQIGLIDMFDVQTYIRNLKEQLATKEYI